MDGEHKVVALQARFDSELHDSPPSGDRAPAPPMVGKSPADEQPVTFQDFYAYMPAHQYLYIPTGEMWPKDSVNGRLPEVFVGGGKPMKPSAWLDQTRPVEQVTWAPGEPNMIEGRLVAGGGGWIDRAGARCLNLYRPPLTRPDGDALKAQPWVDHANLVFGDDAPHIIKWLAQRVQHPGIKINHALVLGGAQGIGKDTLLEPVKHAVGPWNFNEVSPQNMLGRFNGFAKSVVLRVNEARDLGDVDRYKFYDHMKVYIAAPPDVLRCDEKNLREHSVFNVMGVIITTNYKTDGMYLPADDRRHHVAWSDTTKDSFDSDYWPRLWRWYESGGIGHVIAYLSTLDISSFDAKAAPPKTAAFWDIVDSNRAPEDAELADALDSLKRPEVVTLIDIICHADEELRDYLRDRKNRRAIPHRLESAGYVPVRNDSAKDGLWVIGGARQSVYGRTDLPIRDRMGAARMRAAGRL